MNYGRVSLLRSVEAVPPLLGVKKLNVYRGKRPIVIGFDFDIRRGERIFVRGQNGAGKSTLLEALLGLIPSDAGGRSWLEREGSPLDWGALRKGEVFYLRQHSNLFPSLSLKENILLARRIPIREAEDELRAACVAFPELAEGVGRKPSEVSAGQRQIAACVQAAMRRPMLMVLDEPSAGLATRVIPAIYSIFERSLSSGAGTIFTEQHVEHAMRWSTRLVDIKRDQDLPVEGEQTSGRA